MADFKLGRIKFKWRGDWAVDTAYLIDDVIKKSSQRKISIVGGGVAAFELGFAL